MALSSSTGILFIAAEADGFADLPDANAIPSMAGKFHTAALIWLDASHVPMLDFYDQAATRVHVNSPQLSVEYWYQFDVIPSDHLMPLSGCTDATVCATVIKDQLSTANSALQKHTGNSASRISGIHIDTEGAGQHLAVTVAAMGMAAREFSPALSLSFTRGIKQCESKTVAGQEFDHCLGQSYTDCTAALYAETDCGLVDTASLWNVWNQNMPATSKGGFAVPLLCAGGNCQYDLYCGAHIEPTCSLDERLSTQGIALVVSSINTEFYPNMGLWYGFGLKKHICARCAGPPTPVTPAPTPPSPAPPTKSCDYAATAISCTSDTDCATWATTNCNPDQVTFYCKSNGICQFNDNLVGSRDAHSNRTRTQPDSQLPEVVALPNLEEGTSP